MNQITQVKTRKRVSDHGEVFTSEREVNAMLDLVKQETQRIDSRFLEPACGNGNFLAEILRRKLLVVTNRYKKCQHDFERYSILALTSIYGVDILADNVEECRTRLFDIYKEGYEKLYKDACKDECLKAARFILSKNILWGDALSLKAVSEPETAIVFSEWSFVSETKIKRRDFVFADLVSHASIGELPLFSDLGEDVFVPKPVHEYPAIHFMRIYDAT